MDIATVGGIALAAICCFLAIFLGGGNPIAMINIPSVIVVFGGSAGAVIAAFPLASSLGLPKLVMKSIFGTVADPADTIKDIVKYAEIARREGILSLENHIGDMTDEFIIRGIKMAVDGTDPELIRVIMETELEAMMDRHMQGKMVLDNFGKYAPAFGMIGTLIGLILMLGSMEDPSTIGPSMAVALITTLYGAIIANAFAGPIGDKLYSNDQDETRLKTIVIAGVMAIQSGDNPRVVESKLLTYLPPAQRDAFLEAQAA